MRGNETGHLLKCVKLYRKVNNMSGTWHSLRRNIAATSLKILFKNLYSVKKYDKTNIMVFALRQREKCSWGLTYFDQFIYSIFSRIAMDQRQSYLRNVAKHTSACFFFSFSLQKKDTDSMFL